MNIEIRQSKKEEFGQLEVLEKLSFDVNERYFENGEFPGLSKEDEATYSFKVLWEAEDTDKWTIFIDNKIVGAAILKNIDASSKEFVLFFMSPEIQGRGFGQKALKMIEESYPRVNTWRLTTPTQVLRNTVFYVNKCGYSIVSVSEWDKEKECGMFVFEKKVNV